MDQGPSVRAKTRKPPLAYSGDYKTVNEYADALRNSMFNFYHFQCASAAFPFFLANMQASSTARASSADARANSADAPETNSRSQPEQQSQTDARTPQGAGTEYVIPPIWKRIVAEIIDFLMLFLMKLFFTYLAMGFFDLSLLEEVNKYDFETFGNDILADYQLALSMTTEILLLDLVHRLGTCLFEAICLCRSAARTGGATPGKKIMGLRVIKCDHAAYSPTGPTMVIVSPAEDLGFYRALLRSFLKNIAITFLFPIGLTLFSFRHSRTVYDMLSGSIVVESNDPQHI